MRVLQHCSKKHCSKGHRSKDDIIPRKNYNYPWTKYTLLSPWKYTLFSHEGVKFPCRQCDHMAASMSNPAQHKRAVHEGVTYPCRQCNHMATSKDILAQHKRAVHEGVATLFQGTLFQGKLFQGTLFQEDIVPRTTLFQGKIITILGQSTTYCLLGSTYYCLIKGWSSLVGNVTIWQLQWVTLVHIFASLEQCCPLNNVVLGTMFPSNKVPWNNVPWNNVPWNNVFGTMSLGPMSLGTMLKHRSRGGEVPI